MKEKIIKEVLEELKKDDTGSDLWIDNQRKKAINLTLKKQAKQIFDEIEKLIKNEIEEEEIAVKEKRERDWNIINELNFLKQEIGKLKEK